MLQRHLGWMLRRLEYAVNLSYKCQPMFRWTRILQVCVWIHEELLRRLSTATVMCLSWSRRKHTTAALRVTTSWSLRESMKEILHIHHGGLVSQTFRSGLTVSSWSIHKIGSQRAHREEFAGTSIRREASRAVKASWRIFDKGSKSSRRLCVYFLRLQEALLKASRRVHVGFFWEDFVKWRQTRLRRCITL